MEEMSVWEGRVELVGKFERMKGCMVVRGGKMVGSINDCCSVMGVGEMEEELGFELGIVEVRKVVGMEGVGWLKGGKGELDEE